ncbi:hypothetical protein M3Y95_00591100 [Aphelenchoides besseyi]|nr:hypothetical protein M3Y95_00591100 [Aphelenchoides besseyi]
MWHPGSPAASPMGMFCEAMREVAKPNIHLSVPRTSRSLSPSNRQPSKQVPLIRCYSDRDEAPNQTPRLQRANSITGSQKCLPFCPDLTPSQICAIRKSWKHVNTKGLPVVIRRSFQRLESSSSAAAKAFELPPVQNKVVTVNDHTKFLLAFLQRIIDGERDLDIELKRIGAKHAFLEEIGVSIRDIERLNELVAEIFLKLDGVKQSKETTRAWRKLIAEIEDNLRDGFETESKFQRRRRTSFQPGLRRNSMPNSNRKTSLKVDVSQVSRKLSNY